LNVANLVPLQAWQYNTLGQNALTALPDIQSSYAAFQVAEESRSGAINACPSASAYKLIRLWFVTADGARHQLGLFGDLDDAGTGFYATDPVAGVVRTCGNGTGIASSISGPLTYFTVDGTYIKVVIGFPAYVNKTLQYTAYFPDGTVITNNSISSSEQISSMTDRNGNATTFDYKFPAGAPQSTTISNAAGSITIQSSAPAPDRSYSDTITTSGYNGQTLTWTINWGVISFGGTNGYFDCDSLDDYCGAGGTGPFTAAQIQGATAYGQVLVVKSIILPSPTGVPLSFQFGYSDGLNQGWGNVNKVTYPSGLIDSYNYWLDGSPWNSNQPTFLVNPVIKKTVIHTDIVEGVSQSPISDVWSFQYFQGCNKMTGPDQGTDQVCFLNLANSGRALSGMPIKTISPTGSNRKTIPV